MQPAQPLDVHIAFEAGQQQPQRIALLRAQPLAVLAVHQHGIVEAFLDRNAARHRRRIGAFGDDPFGVRLQSGFLQHQLQADPGPFGTTQQTDEIGRRLAVGFCVNGIAGAFEEMDSRLRREAPDVLHGEDHRLVDEAMEHQPMLRRVDRGNAAVMPFVEQPVRRDNAVQISKRCPSGRGQILRQIVRNIFNHALLERRRRSIKLASHRIARFLHPLGNIWREIVGIVRGRQSLRAGETAQNGPTHQGATLP